jgi:phosphoserine phosphatase RsbU/P
VDLEPLRFFAEAAVISIEKALLHHQILEAQRIETQLETAKEIQKRLLPESPPSIPGYDISGLCLPTYAIGGDYFDYLQMGNGRLGVVIADVAGDGIPAALVMSAFRALVRSQASQVSSRGSGSSTRSSPHRQTSPSRFISRINRLLPEISGFTTFVTAVFGILIPERGDFLYSVCGHHPPIISRQGGTPRHLRKDGIALGVIRRAQYKTQKLQLAVGDVLMFYTDGVVELEDAHGEPFGTERLRLILKDNLGKSSREILNAVVGSVQSFTGLEAFPDDFTLLVIRRIPRPPDAYKTRRHQRPIDIVA